MFLEIKSPKIECRRFFSTFANFEKNENCQTFWTCISKTNHPKVSFGKIKWNLIFWSWPVILDPYWHSVLKGIWHEHSFLSGKRLLLKNSKLKIWENSDKTTRSYDRLNLPIFRSKFGPFCCSAKTWSRDQKRSSWRHLVSARKHSKYKGIDTV